MKRFLRNLGFGVIALVILVAILEIVFRLATGPMQATKGQRIAQRQDSETEYSLIPDLDSEFGGVRVVTNSLGLRDFRAPHKSEDKWQILVLGDSFTFGLGVPLEESYPYILERLLNESSSGTEYEVINAGVPGYDTVAEAQLLNKIIGHYSPRWVIVGFHPGDFVSHEELQKKFLVRLREQLRKKSAFFAWAQRVYKTKLIKYVPPPRAALSVDPATVFQTQSGTRIKQALQDIHTTAADNGADTIVFIICPLIEWESYPYKALHSSLAQFCEENGMGFVDPLNTFTQYDAASLWVGPNDGHYSAEANRIAAEVLREFLETAGSQGQ
jgi:hypothetical protein